MSTVVFHPTALFSQKAKSASKFSLTAPQVGLLLAINKQAHVIGGEIKNDGRYQVRLSNLTEDSWVKLMSQCPALRADNHISRVQFFTMQFSPDKPAIVLPADLYLPSPLPIALLPLLEASNSFIQSSGVCIISCHENGELSLSYRD